MSPLTPFTEPDEVLAAIKDLTDRIHSGLYRLLPTTRKYFEAQGLPVDKALHAMMTRFQLKHQLLRQQIDATDEEPAAEDAVAITGVANCGLVISSPSFVLRILKWRKGELPPSASRERFEFYQCNLFVFEMNDPFPDRPVPPLNLVAAWETNTAHELQSFSVVCPLGQSGNRVQNKWWRTLELPMGVQSANASSKETLPPEPALDEITPKDRGDDFGPTNRRVPGTTDAETDDAS